MAPVPKRKHSTQRSRKREEKLKIRNLASFPKCPNCQSPKRPHYVCEECGYYGDTQVVKKKTKDKKKSKA